MASIRNATTVDLVIIDAEEASRTVQVITELQEALGDLIIDVWNATENKSSLVKDDVFMRAARAAHFPAEEILAGSE